jgi:hypothetical protein
MYPPPTPTVCSVGRLYSAGPFEARTTARTASGFISGSCCGSVTLAGGRVAERTNAHASKACEVKASGGSNPPPSAVEFDIATFFLVVVVIRSLAVRRSAPPQRSSQTAFLSRPNQGSIRVVPNPPFWSPGAMEAASTCESAPARTLTRRRPGPPDHRRVPGSTGRARHDASTCVAQPTLQ